MTWRAEAQDLPDLEPTAAARLDKLSVTEVPRGTVLFHPGDSVQGFVIVLSGRIDVFLTGPTGRDILLYSVAPGQSCVQSTLGLLGGEDYSAEAVVTQQDTKVVLVPRDVFLTLMDDSLAFRRFVFQAFAGRLQAMMHLLEKVAFQRVEARLAETLLARAENGRVEATHAELASFIGSAREVVSRRLDALARRGLVSLDRGAVMLRDPESLEAIAEDLV